MDEAPVPAATPPAAPPSAPGPGRPRLVRVAAGFYGIVLLFAIGYALFSGEIKKLLGTQAPSAGAVLGAIAIAGALVALGRVGVKAWKPMARTVDAMEEAIGPISVGDALLLAGMSGVAEEVLFRGALWWDLKLVGSALLFGLVHVLPRRPFWVYPVWAAVAGAFLGLLREADGNVLPPILAHVLVNAAGLSWLGARARKKLSPAPVPSPGTT